MADARGRGAGEVEALNSSPATATPPSLSSLVDHQGQQLVLQAALRHREVDQRALRLHLRREVRPAAGRPGGRGGSAACHSMMHASYAAYSSPVGVPTVGTGSYRHPCALARCSRRQLGVQDEAEGFVVLHLLVAQLYVQRAALQADGKATRSVLHSGWWVHVVLQACREATLKLALLQLPGPSQLAFLKVARVMSGVSTASIVSPMFSMSTVWPCSSSAAHMAAVNQKRSRS